MSTQDEYNREVVAKARQIVAAAGLDKMPLTQAMGQIAFGFERVGAEAVQKLIDDKG